MVPKQFIFVYITVNKNNGSGAVFTHKPCDVAKVWSTFPTVLCVGCTQFV